MAVNMQFTGKHADWITVAIILAILGFTIVAIIAFVNYLNNLQNKNLAPVNTNQG